MTDAPNETTEIAVIGAGVVGSSIAYRLARAGHTVTVIAPTELGDGASYGNAGVIADYAVLPVGTPAVLRALPSLLLDPDSPLALRRAAIPALAPWLARFLRQSMPGAARRNARAIATLLAHAAQDWTDLAAEIGAEPLLRRRGVLSLYETPGQRAAAQADLAWRRSHGVQVELLGPHELGQLEPALRTAAEGGAAYFPDTLSVSDPGAVLAHLTAALAAHSVPRILDRAETLRRTREGVEITGPGFRLSASRVVIAAGAHSRPLALAAGDRVPLETERGYHLEWDMPVPPVSRPASPTARGFYLCPMQGRLRVAGTVELGGLDAPPSPHRLTALEDGARAILPDLPTPDRAWMGFRPSVPDSVPVIGPSRAGPDILLAFGHGHLGLTLAPVTARIVEALVTGAAAPVPLAPYLPARF